MARLYKPTMTSVWRGQKGNKFRVYKVKSPEGKIYYHQNRANAVRQFEAGKRVYKIRKARMKK